MLIMSFNLCPMNQIPALRNEPPRSIAHHGLVQQLDQRTNDRSRREAAALVGGRLDRRELAGFALGCCFDLAAFHQVLYGSGADRSAWRGVRNVMHCARRVPVSPRVDVQDAPHRVSIVKHGPLNNTAVIYGTLLSLTLAVCLTYVPALQGIMGSASADYIPRLIAIGTGSTTWLYREGTKFIARRDELSPETKSFVTKYLTWCGSICFGDVVKLYTKADDDTNCVGFLEHKSDQCLLVVPPVKDSAKAKYNEAEFIISPIQCDKPPAKGTPLHYKQSFVLKTSDHDGYSLNNKIKNAEHTIGLQACGVKGEMYVVFEKEGYTLEAASHCSSTHSGKLASRNESLTDVLRACVIGSERER
ncbi:Sodium/potassium-transporting atpase subunit alpha, partial [Globisporangium splendens]